MGELAVPATNWLLVAKKPCAWPHMQRFRVRIQVRPNPGSLRISAKVPVFGRTPWTTAQACKGARRGRGGRAAMIDRRLRKERRKRTLYRGLGGAGSTGLVEQSVRPSGGRWSPRNRLGFRLSGLSVASSHFFAFIRRPLSGLLFGVAPALLARRVTSRAFIHRGETSVMARGHSKADAWEQPRPRSSVLLRLAFLTLTPGGQGQAGPFKSGPVWMSEPCAQKPSH